MCRSNSVRASVSFVCDACNVEHYVFNRINVGVFDYCGRCADDHTFICNNCDDRQHTEYLSDDVRGVCKECVDNEFCECERCNDFVPNDDTRNVQCGDSSRHDEQWCEDCADRFATTCDDCNELTSYDEILSYNRDDICMQCYYQSYFTCDCCNNVIHNDNYGGENQCEQCYVNPDNIDSSDLASYGSEEWRSLKRYGKCSDYLGIEIELESKDRNEFSDNIDYLRQFDCYCALERDGSLTDYGVEIQTTCADLETHRAKLKELYSGIMARFKSESHTGIHISMDGDTLKSWHKGKIWTFINSSCNEKFVDHIARRRANGYCSRYTQYRIGKDSRGAVNMQNRNRLELRIFRSTVRYERIIEFLEFADCLRSYVRSGASWSSLGYYDLLTYAVKVKKYPNLVNRIMEFNEE